MLVLLQVKRRPTVQMKQL